MSITSPSIVGGATSGASSMTLTGTSSSRPTTIPPGQSEFYLDTTLGKMIYWSSPHWYDLTGTQVADYMPSPITLQALTLSNASFTAGSVSGIIIGAIQNKASGSTLTLSDSHSNAVAISGSNLVVGSTATASAGTFTTTIVETLQGAAGSPNSTTLTITVSAAASGNAFTGYFFPPIAA